MWPNPSFQRTLRIKPRKAGELTLELMSDPLFDTLRSVNDEASFLRFVEALRADRAEANLAAPTVDGFQNEWANQTTEQFLAAGISWAQDSGFGSHPGPKSSNLWQLFAQFLWAGRGYE